MNHLQQFIRFHYYSIWFRVDPTGQTNAVQAGHLLLPPAPR